MPHEGYANPIMNDGLRFHLDMPVSEVTERVTRAIEASDVSSTPLVAETTDGVTITKTSRPSIGPYVRGFEESWTCKETECTIIECFLRS